MSYLERGGNAALYYEYSPPTPDGSTFVFVNALTGNTGAWQAEIGPALREQGHGTLAYNMRGQPESRFAASDELDEDLIVTDLVALLEHIAPPRPLLTGLSIGGLFAARALERGAAADGLVLINTLRKPTLALEWANEAMTRAARLGGPQFLMDLFLPFLVNPDFLAAMRGKCLGSDEYEGMGDSEGPMQLMAHARSVNWDLAYENIAVPVLVMSGLLDRVFYHRADVAELQGRIPDAREVEFADAGHLIPMERGARTAQALLDFAKELAGR